MFRSFTAAAILALTITAAQAGPSAIVRFGDLDLSRPEDVQVLNNRVEQAAKTACTDFLRGHGFEYYQYWFVSCVRYKADQTSAQIANLSSKHRAIASK